MSETEKYVRRYLKNELAEVQQSPISDLENGLTIFEKTLIYYYTKDGYRKINKSLRKGRTSKVSELLGSVLSKLPDHLSLVHRTAYLENRQLNGYRNAFQKGLVILDRGFISASKSILIGRAMPKFNAKFQISTRSGKSIKEFSFSPNEEEILIMSGTSFQVVDVIKKGNYLLIKLEKI